MRPLYQQDGPDRSRFSLSISRVFVFPPPPSLSGTLKLTIPHPAPNTVACFACAKVGRKCVPVSVIFLSIVSSTIC